MPEMLINNNMAPKVPRSSHLNLGLCSLDSSTGVLCNFIGSFR